MQITLRQTLPLLGAGVLIGLLLAGIIGFFLDAATRRDFLTATGYGVGIGLGALAGIVLFNWLVGFIDRVKSGRL
jgi:hypothetical protein